MHSLQKGFKERSVTLGSTRDVTQGEKHGKQPLLTLIMEQLARGVLASKTQMNHSHRQHQVCA